MHEQANDYRLLYTIIESSQNLYCINNCRKQYLSMLLADHSIWHEAHPWKECMQEIIAVKSDDAIRRRKQLSIPASEVEKEKKGFFKKGLKSLKGMLSSKPTTD